MSDQRCGDCGRVLTGDGYGGQVHQGSGRYECVPGGAGSGRPACPAPPVTARPRPPVPQRLVFEQELAAAAPVVHVSRGAG